MYIAHTRTIYIPIYTLKTFSNRNHPQQYKSNNNNNNSTDVPGAGYQRFSGTDVRLTVIYI